MASALTLGSWSCPSDWSWSGPLGQVWRRLPPCKACSQGGISCRASQRLLQPLFLHLDDKAPGIPLENTADPLFIKSEEPWPFELKECVTSMREWQPPYNGSICSIIGTPLRSARVPNHIMGPFANEAEFHDFFLRAVWGYGFDTTAEYIEALR